MEPLHKDHDEHIHNMEAIAHKLLLIGRALRLGCEKAADHLCGDDDKRFLKELENKDPHKVKEQLLQELQYRTGRHYYSNFVF